MKNTQQQQRVKWVSEQNLENMKAYELEAMADYILQGDSSKKKGFLSEKKLQTKLNREKMTVSNEDGVQNLVDTEYVNQIAGSTVYITTETEEGQYEYQEVIDQYEVLLAKAREEYKANRSPKISSIINGITNDIDYIKHRNEFSAKKTMTTPSHEERNEQITLSTIDNVIRSFYVLNERKDLMSPVYHTFLVVKIALEKIYEELTEQEKIILAGIMEGYKLNEIVKIARTSKSQLIYKNDGTKLNKIYNKIKENC